MAEKVDIWMPFYPGDYLASTMHLTCEESGAYLHLLFHSWKVGPLPKDTEQLRRIARVDKKPWVSVWAALRGFFTEAADGFVQGRLERERAEWTERKAAQVAKAKEAADKRWGKRKECLDDAPTNATSNAPSIATRTGQAMLEQCPSSSSSPSPERTTPPTPSSPRGREAKPDVRANAKHVASERTIGMYRPGPSEPQRSPEDEAALEREVDALFAKPERAQSRRAPGDLARLSMPATLAALRTQLARPEPSAGLTAARAMLQHLYALFQAQFNKPGNESEGWEDALAAWNRCFEHVTVGDVELDGETTVVYLVTDRPRDLADGLAKYQHKVRTAMRQAFGREVQIVPRDVAVAA